MDPLGTLNEVSVGASDWTLVEPDASLDDPTATVVDWLDQRGFTLERDATELLRGYVDASMNLLAFEFPGGMSHASARPLFITYPGTRPVLPLRATRAAAIAETELLVWVVGNGRAVPTNSFALELDDARIDWVVPVRTYRQLVRGAMDEAGFGFFTQFSGESKMRQRIYPQLKLDEFRALDIEGRLERFFYDTLKALQADGFVHESLNFYYDGVVEAGRGRSPSRTPRCPSIAASRG